MITYKTLNPETLEPDANGERYQEHTIGSSVIISACPILVVEDVDPPIIGKTIEERLESIETTQDIILLKMEGVLA